ncbi:MAG: phospholipase D-like domain-containing protein [Gallionellaceae bacterium]|jgi:hypothetical protein
MSRLVYHNKLSNIGGVSPFDQAVLEVAGTGAVDIVSPYVSISYLKRIINVSHEWRLISDVEAWLRSLPIRSRPNALSFIRSNLNQIHHCHMVHAKTVIGQGLAMFGSANFTNTGMLNRDELSVLIDDPVMIGELDTWFNLLWDQTASPVADETSDFVDWLGKRTESHAKSEKFTLSAKGRNVRASLVRMPAPEQEDNNRLSLGIVAHEIVVDEQKHYESLGEVIEFSINKMASNGFTFRQMSTSVHQSFSDTTTREIYFAILRYCANHVRSVFAVDTINRLIYSKGIFIQSTRESIFQVLAHYDEFLSQLVQHFDFSKAADMPGEEDLELSTGIQPVHQEILISDLIDAGFIDIEDKAGSLAQYRLSEDFEWSERYRLFKVAAHLWNAKHEHFLLHKPAIVIDQQKPESIPAPTKSIEDMVAELHTRRRAAHADAINQQEIEKFKKVDRILVYVLYKCFSNEKLHAFSDATVVAISRATGHKKSFVAKTLDSLLSRKGRGIVVVNNGYLEVTKDLDAERFDGYPLSLAAYMTSSLNAKSV